jgi:threonine aldolase
MKPSRSFASDNNAGIHPDILQAIVAANDGHVVSYGDDPYTPAAVQRFREHLGPDVEVFFVFGGTAANVLGLKAITQPHHAILCAETAHIHQDECGAPEQFTGCKLLLIPSSDGKVTVDGIRRHLHGIGFEHHVQPRVVSLSQATELGTVYTPAEIRALADFAHAHNLLVHVDGARLANAAAGLDEPLRALTTDAGVDVLSFGGTKNGLMCGEAVVFFHKELAAEFKYTRKQGMQLASKMRFLAVQFDALLSNDLWRRNAAHANAMARLLAERLAGVPRITITRKVEANAVFALVPPQCVPVLQQHYFFYVWDEAASEVRWMTSFDSSAEDVEQFVHLLRQVVL